MQGLQKVILIIYLLQKSLLITVVNNIKYSKKYFLSNTNQLDRSFYQSSDVCSIAKGLIGKVFYTHIGNELTAGRIIETEAYAAPEDLASHARNNTRTPRTETFWAREGTVYMYICYGIHNMLNIITGDESTPHAILIRAIEPVFGIEHMQERRSVNKLDKTLTGGPGRVAQALGLSKEHNNLDLIKDDSLGIVEFPWPTGQKIKATPRIGIDPVPEPWLSKPFRYVEEGNKFSSR